MAAKENQQAENQKNHANTLISRGGYPHFATKVMSAFPDRWNFGRETCSRHCIAVARDDEAASLAPETDQPAVFSSSRPVSRS
jgi:hypothetical protein